MRLACSIRSSCAKPRSLLTLARTASALKCTPLRRGTSMLASVVLPAPGRPMISPFLLSLGIRSVPLFEFGANMLALDATALAPCATRGCLAGLACRADLALLQARRPIGDVAVRAQADVGDVAAGELVEQLLVAGGEAHLD